MTRQADGGRPAAGDRPISVLQSVRGPSATTNPYVVQLVDALRPDLDVKYFTWRGGLLGRYDLFHVHWPEVMVRRASIIARLAARVRFALLMLRLTALRTPVVRTVHNPGPHEPGDLVERILLGWCDRLTVHRVLLTSTTPVAPGHPSTVIAHGDYRAWFARYPPAARQPGTLLHFGLIRPYKGVDALLTAFRQLPDPQARLRVIGRPATPDLARLVTDAVRRDRRVSTTLEHVDDAALVREIGAAQLVVLPYQVLVNSGALLLALSLGRPALVPSTPSTDQLAEEVGTGWVLRYDPATGLTADVLGRALQASAGVQGSPDLSLRGWPRSAALHAQVYASVLRPRRSGA